MMCDCTIICRFLPEIVSKCVHPINRAGAVAALSETTEVIVGWLPWCALLQLAGVASTIQENCYVNVLEETWGGENINSCKDRTHSLKKKNKAN